MHIFNRYPLLPLLTSFLLILAVFSWGFSSYAQRPFIVDEYHHFAQFRIFLDGEWKMDSEIPNIPGYHLILASLGKIFQFQEFSAARLATSFISFFCVVIFYFSARCISEEGALLKSLQFAFLPILFPFFFLIYADVFSLLLVVTSTLAFTKGQRNPGYLFCILSVLVRQSNIIWLLFFFVYAYLEDFGWIFKLKDIYEHCLRSWLCLIGFLSFCLFVLINEGVSMGHVKYHPTFSFHTGNIFFYLFLLFCLSVPIFLSRGKQLVSAMMNWKYSLPTIITVTAIFYLSFKVDNPLNSYQNHLRNQLLYYFNNSVWHQTLLLLTCLFTIFGLTTVQLSKKSYYIIYPATILFLAPVWLIEQRYYLVPFMLFLLYRKPANIYIEALQVGLYLSASIWLTSNIVNSKGFFL